MMPIRINRDVIAAIVLLLFCGAFWAASYQVPDMGFQGLGSVVWPRIILVALALMSLIFLVTASSSDEPAETHSDRHSGWLRHYLNPIVCFVLFFLFLVSMPYLGMLLAGILFVFLTLSFLGERSLKALLLHAAIAAVTIGAMWSIFTFALKVMLPPGELLPGF